MEFYRALAELFFAYGDDVRFRCIAADRTKVKGLHLRDYDQELRRRARTREELLAAFRENLHAFESSWYGRHEVTSETFTRFSGNLERIRAC